MVQNSLYRDVFRDAGLLDVLLQHVDALITYMDVAGVEHVTHVTRAVHDEDDMHVHDAAGRVVPLLADAQLYQLGMSTLQTMLDGSSENVKVSDALSACRAIASAVSCACSCPYAVSCHVHVHIPISSSVLTPLVAPYIISSPPPHIASQH